MSQWNSYDFSYSDVMTNACVCVHFVIDDECW